MPLGPPPPNLLMTQQLKSSIWQSGGLLRPVPVLSIAGAYGLVVGKHFEYHSTLSSNAQ